MIICLWDNINKAAHFHGSLIIISIKAKQKNITLFDSLLSLVCEFICRTIGT